MQTECSFHSEVITEMIPTRFNTEKPSTCLRHREELSSAKETSPKVMGKDEERSTNAPGSSNGGDAGRNAEQALC